MSTAGLFITKQRESGESFVTLSESAPEWARDMVHAAHGDSLPDDWTYSVVADVVGFVVDAGEFASDLNDAAAEIGELLTPVATWERIAWLSSDLSRVSLVDEYVSEYGWSASGLAENIGGAMALEIGNIGAIVIEAMSNAYDEYVTECDADECEAHTVAGWFVHGFPTGPLGGGVK